MRKPKPFKGRFEVRYLEYRGATTYQRIYGRTDNAETAYDWCRVIDNTDLWDLPTIRDRRRNPD